MTTAVHVNTQTYSTTHVAVNLVRGLKQLITGCGMDASKLLGCWRTVELGVATWLRYSQLERLTLEVYDPNTNVLVTRFDFDIDHGYYPGGDGELWLDPETVAYAIRKAGAVPSKCSYDIFARTTPGSVKVDGWGAGTLRSTSGLRRRGVGATVGGCSLGATLNYWS